MNKRMRKKHKTSGAERIGRRYGLLTKHGAVMLGVPSETPIRFTLVHVPVVGSDYADDIISLRTGRRLGWNLRACDVFAIRKSR